MPEGRDNDTLSFSDALFLYLEREGMPLNVASVCTFEGKITFDLFCDFIDSKLPLVPRYLQRVVSPPFDIGVPTWQYDPEFEIRNHIREIVLKRGTEFELRTTASKLLSQNMDRSRPLWDLTLVRGLKDDRSALIARVHHCLVDGIGGVALMNAIMDPSPVPPATPHTKKRPFKPPPPRDPATVLLDGFINAVFSSVQRILSAQVDALSVAQRLAASFGERSASFAGPGGLNGDGQFASLEDLTRFLPELLAPTQRLPFNRVCRGPQRFSWSEVPLDEIKTVKNTLGATVNDIVLTVVTDAVGRYVEFHGVKTQGRFLRIVVPVNVRGSGDGGELGNRVSFVPVTVPLDMREPVKLVAMVKERTAFAKSAHLADLVGLAGTLLTLLPTPIQAAAGPIASQLPVSMCNLICTNVPGPTAPLYLLGHKMLSWYPYVPIGGEMGLNCAVLTYNGTAFFGFSSDVHALPDVDRLAKLANASFAELRKGAGVRRWKRARSGSITNQEQETAGAGAGPENARAPSTAGLEDRPKQVNPEQEKSVPAGVGR